MKMMLKELRIGVIEITKEKKLQKKKKKKKKKKKIKKIKKKTEVLLRLPSLSSPLLHFFSSPIVSSFFLPKNNNIKHR